MWPLVEVYDPDPTWASIPTLLWSLVEVPIMSNVYKIVVRPSKNGLVVSRVVSGARGGFYTEGSVTLPRQGFKSALRGEAAQAIIRGKASLSAGA